MEADELCESGWNGRVCSAQSWYLTSFVMLGTGMSSGGRLESKGCARRRIILNDGRGLEISMEKEGGSQRRQPAELQGRR